MNRARPVARLRRAIASRCPKSAASGCHNGHPAPRSRRPVPPPAAVVRRRDRRRADGDARRAEGRTHPFARVARRDADAQPNRRLAALHRLSIGVVFISEIPGIPKVRNRFRLITTLALLSVGWAIAQDVRRRLRREVKRPAIAAPTRETTPTIASVRMYMQFQKLDSQGANECR